MKFGNHTTIISSTCILSTTPQVFDCMQALILYIRVIMAVLYQLGRALCILLFSIFSNLTNAHVKMKRMNFSTTEKNFTIQCDFLVTSSHCDSLTLSQIARNSTQATHVYIDIGVSQLQLPGKVEFEHHESVIIAGKNTIISCQERESGLVFVDVTRVMVVSVTLTNCGEPYQKYGKIAICLFRCRDIDFIHVSAIKSMGTAVSILKHQGGTVNFSNCSFIENTITSVKNNQTIFGGGGVYIGDFDHDPPIPTKYYFTKCLFMGNIPHTRFYYFLYTNEVGQSISGYGRGGGVFLSFQKLI